ncbi:MAG: protein translocase subunit SecD [Bdellovibrionales bacterium]|nr:protein translocase subunit SecD [Bdellovibrionales bacterium]
MTPDIKRRVGIYFAIIVCAFIFLIPTLFPSSFKNSTWISKPISLGLDLSGGVYLVYEVKAHEAVTGRLQAIAAAIRSDLRREKVAVTRARVNDAGEVEIQLFSAKTEERAKKVVEESYKELSLLGSDAAGSKITLRYGIGANAAQSIERTAVDQAIETLRNRVDQFGVAEPLIQKVGVKRIVLQMPGVSDVEAVKSLVGRVAKLEFRFKPNSETRPYQVKMKDRQGADVYVEDEVQMTGEVVDDARVSILDGQVEVSLSLTSEGARTFRRITTDGVGRQLAIILDGVEYSAPNIREPIAGGRASITGGFDMTEARELAVVLRAGALPAPLEVLEERTIGPTLGKESIRKGITAILAGFVLVMAFMVAYYKKSGIAAVASLLLNVLLVVAGLSAFGATLTLPGLAGLALTIGMAVDANVIIFERIREELRNGAGRDAAVSAGFDKALSAIIDSNITTLLAGVILYYFGTGPIKGFAVTLSIGILTTIYCATFVARLSFDFFELKGRKGLSI